MGDRKVRNNINCTLEALFLPDTELQNSIIKNWMVELRVFPADPKNDLKEEWLLTAYIPQNSFLELFNEYTTNKFAEIILSLNIAESWIKDFDYETRYIKPVENEQNSIISIRGLIDSISWVY
jgi:hypothetical protein